MALNQENFRKYMQLDENEKRNFLNHQLQNNILSFYKGLSFRTSDRIMAVTQVEEKQTQFKKPVHVGLFRPVHHKCVPPPMGRNWQKP
ncbi:MAG: CRISPR-associated endonuclease Cas6 [Mangrovibacterium sp.]